MTYIPQEENTDMELTLESQEISTKQQSGGMLGPSPCSLFLGDCLQVMATLEAGSIDAIITDLPYGTTACKWDVVIPFAPLWEQVRRVLKPNGVFVTTASQPFTTALINSNLAEFRYEMIWDKDRPTGFALANKQPLKVHENICVFYRSQPTYNPQKTKGRPNNAQTKGNKGGGTLTGNGSQPILGKTVVDLSGDKFPVSIIYEKRGGASTTVHPTQKPLELMRYMVRTYTNPGDVVLDPCMGSGTTCLAAKLEGRGYVGIEREPKYFETAKTRIEGDADLFSANA
jgi:DNA modification methylase